MPVSVIIPTLNEAACLADAVRSVRAQGPAEIIVADGGSSDATRAAAATAASTAAYTSRTRRRSSGVTP